MATPSSSAALQHRPGPAQALGRTLMPADFTRVAVVPLACLALPASGANPLREIAGLALAVTLLSIAVSVLVAGCGSGRDNGTGTAIGGRARGLLLAVPFIGGPGALLAAQLDQAVFILVLGFLALRLLEALNGRGHAVLDLVAAGAGGALLADAAALTLGLVPTPSALLPFGLAWGVLVASGMHRDDDAARSDATLWLKAAAGFAVVACLASLMAERGEGTGTEPLLLLLVGLGLFRLWQRRAEFGRAATSGVPALTMGLAAATAIGLAAWLAA